MISLNLRKSNYVLGAVNTLSACASKWVAKILHSYSGKFLGHLSFLGHLLICLYANIKYFLYFTFQADGKDVTGGR